MNDTASDLRDIEGSRVETFLPSGALVDDKHDLSLDSPYALKLKTYVRSLDQDA